MKSGKCPKIPEGLLYRRGNRESLSTFYLSVFPHYTSKCFEGKECISSITAFPEIGLVLGT